jgi:hypothetical protein
MAGGSYIIGDLPEGISMRVVLPSGTVNVGPFDGKHTMVVAKNIGYFNFSNSNLYFDDDSDPKAVHWVRIKDAPERHLAAVADIIFSRSLVLKNPTLNFRL